MSQSTPSTKAAAKAVDEAELSAQVQQLRDDFSNLASTLTALAKDSTGAARDRVVQLAAGMGDKGRDVASSVASEARDLEARAATAVRDRPMTSLAIAAGTGFIIGLLTSRRS